MVVYYLFECDYNTTQAWALAWPWVWHGLVIIQIGRWDGGLFECDYNTTQAWALAWPWVWQ